MKKLLALLLFVCAPAWATTHYVCDCAGAEAHASCTAGSSGFTGLSSAAPKQYLSQIAHNTLAAGSTVNFCKGGDWTAHPQINLQNHNATKASPFTFDSYTPSWGASARPILRFVDGAIGIYLADYPPTLNGFVIQNLELRGNASVDGRIRHAVDSPAISVYGDSHYITIKNMVLKAFARGFTGNRDGANYSSHIKILDSTFIDNGYAGFLSELPDTLLQGNTFTNNGACAWGRRDADNVTGATSANPILITVTGTHTYSPNAGVPVTMAGMPGAFAVLNGNAYTATPVTAPNTFTIPVDGSAFAAYTSGGTATQTMDCSSSGGAGHGNMHSIYVSGDANRMTIRRNTITKTGWNPNNMCEGAIFTLHGTETFITIEDNYIYETAAGGGCYGIGYGDSYNEAGEASRNLIIRGNVVVNVGDLYYAVTSSPGTIFENNVAINTGVSNGGSGTAFGVQARNFAGALPTSAITFRNNSAYFAAGTTGSGITFNAANTGAGHSVSNNLIYIAGGTAKCWDVNAKPASDFAYFDYNLCYNLGSGGNTPPTGMNLNGLTSNPLLRTNPPVANAWDMQIQTTSPAKNAGTPVTARRARLAIKGYPAVGTRDIGAFEYGSNP